MDKKEDKKKVKFSDVVCVGIGTVLVAYWILDLAIPSGYLVLEISLLLGFIAFALSWYILKDDLRRKKDE